MRTTVIVHSLVTGRRDPHEVVASDTWTVSVDFPRGQFPSETYTITFDAMTGKPLEKRFEKLVEIEAGNPQPELF